MTIRPRAWLHLWIVAILPDGLAAQTLEQRIRAAGNGTVLLSFAARPGICGGWSGINIQHQDDEWEQDCRTEPVRVALKVRDHKVSAIETRVGGRWRGGRLAADLGMVGPQEAARYFLVLAERRTELEGDPVLPAALADSVTIWPSLIDLARSTTAPQETRRSAIFWLGQAAAGEAGQALDSIAWDARGDREVRKQAVFALSQRSNDEAVPALIRIARTNPDPELRKSALFWLAQSEDPRAVDLFEEILR
jgi:HEAT repeats